MSPPVYAVRKFQASRHAQFTDTGAAHFGKPPMLRRPAPVLIHRQIMLPQTRCLLSLATVACLTMPMPYALAQAGEEPPPLDELRELVNAYSVIKNDYVSAEQSKTLFKAAIAGMVASLDPHSAYLDKDALTAEREFVSGQFFGVGVEAESRNGVLRVISAREGSPAELAGIKPGDVLVSVDGKPILGMTPEQVGRRLRGALDTPVTLTVSRRSSAAPLAFSLVRKQVTIPSVKGKIVAPGFGYIRIAEFQERTVEDLVRQVRELGAVDGSLQGLVLDLRNDPGGLVSAAIGVAAVFLPKDVAVVSIRGRLPDSVTTLYARREFYGPVKDPDPLTDLPALSKTVPLVVLVNAGSASAAEILAGALQDHRRATVLGTPSFGKGSIQEVRPLSPDTAIKLTVARYYTPAGHAIQATGITPDLAVRENRNADVSLREVDLDNHLSRNPDAPNDDAAGVSPGGASSGESEAARKAPADARAPEFGSKDDFALAQAIRHLRGQPVEVIKPKLALGR